MSVSLYDELEAVAERFGVDLEQVRRDHLLSHVLAAISARVPTDDVVFFGGTALSRTYLADARLSEDIDLIALVPRAQLAGAIESAVARGLARSHGRVSRPVGPVGRGILARPERLGLSGRRTPGPAEGRVLHRPRSVRGHPLPGPEVRSQVRRRIAVRAPQ